MITPGCDGFNAAWRYLMNGTWGVCLQKINMASIGKKELSRLKIANLVSSATNQQLNEAEKVELQQAIDDYNSAAKEFIPYFAPQSSRCREIETAKDNYLR